MYRAALLAFTIVAIAVNFNLWQAIALYALGFLVVSVSTFDR